MEHEDRAKDDMGGWRAILEQCKALEEDVVELNNPLRDKIMAWLQPYKELINQRIEAEENNLIQALNPEMLEEEFIKIDRVREAVTKRIDELSGEIAREGSGRTNADRSS
jgi:hemerythrin-like domain-containing protein